MISASASRTLRIGFVPEHFSTPLAFAQQHYKLNAQLIPFPTGTGALANALKSDKPDEAIDVAIGLTEGFVADIGKTITSGAVPTYGLIGTYVNSPLRWAISTGFNRSDVEVSKLNGSRVGVSRIGSGSYVMSYVLAEQQGWLKSSSEPYVVKPIGDFAALRQAVNNNEADFFMWEHFTTRLYWNNGELRRIGEIYTPWPSWMITARKSVDDSDLKAMLNSINEGIKHYKDNTDEAVKYITSAMHYSEDDAREWMTTVQFPVDVTGVKTRTVEETIAILCKAGVLDQKTTGTSGHMITIVSG